MTIGRRQFVTELALGALVAASVPSSGAATTQMEDPPNTHNMLVVGERTVFLSHLPMFGGLNKNKAAFVSPHRYQVIVEAAFTTQGKDVTGLYRKDRQAHPDTRIYTLGPEPFGTHAGVHASGQATLAGLHCVGCPRSSGGAGQRAHLGARQDVG